MPRLSPRGRVDGGRRLGRDDGAEPPAEAAGRGVIQAQELELSENRNQRRVGVMGVVGLTAFLLAACGSGGGGRSATGPSHSSTTTTNAQVPTTDTTPSLPPATPAEDALAQDLVAVKTASATATAGLTTIHSNQATGSTYSYSQIDAAVQPVVDALTTALRQLTTTIPTLPTNTTEQAQNLSSSLSDELQGIQSTESLNAQAENGESGLPDGAAVAASMSMELTPEFQGDLGEYGALEATTATAFAQQLEADVS